MYKKITLSLFLICTTIFYAQVGIGTTTPAPGAALDIDSDSGGILIPRVTLVETTLQTPIIGPTPANGLMVYNTASINDVTPGFYYWNGSAWERMASGASTDWSRVGNAGTDPDINYIGTTNAVDFRVRTGGNQRFNFTNNGRLRSYDNGTAGQPTYSWNNDANTGIFRPAADNLAFSTNGAERMRVAANGNVGVNNNNPSQRLHVNGNLHLDGALMPGGNSGNTDQIMISKGAGNEPEWGPSFLNVASINYIGKFYAGPFNSNSGTYLALTITDPNMTNNSAVTFNLLGDLPAGGPQWGNNFRILAEPRNGEVIFYVTNASGFNVTNLSIVYVAFYN